MNVARLWRAIPVAQRWTVGLALVCAGCGAARESRDSVALAELDAVHRAELQTFEAARADFRARTDLTHVRDFGPRGQLHVRDVELLGWPENAFLRVEFTYVHTGAAVTGFPTVTLAVTDAEGRATQSATRALSLPYRVKFAQDSTYSSWLEVAVGDLYKRPDWRWDIHVDVPPSE